MVVDIVVVFVNVVVIVFNVLLWPYLLLQITLYFVVVNKCFSEAHKGC